MTLSRQPPLVIFLFLIMLGGLVGYTPAWAADGSLAVTRITPSGDDVPALRQLVIEFDRAVVPLGRMERTGDEIPITIAPHMDCEWRWISDRALACQLGENDALRLSTHYTVDIEPGFKALDGSTVAAPVKHDFITTRVAVDRSGFSDWSGPGMPSLLVTFNQPVRRDSIVKSLSFHWKEGGEARRAVKAEAGPDWSTAPDDALVDVPREPGLWGLVKRLISYIPWFRSDDTAAPQEWARRAWLVTPTTPLPLGVDVELEMAPGLISAQGPERSISDQQIKKFATFGDFKFLGVRCQSNDNRTVMIAPNGPQAELCGPWNTVRLVFSSPVQLRQIKEHAVISPELGKPAPDVDAWADVDLDQTEGYYKWSGHSKDAEFTARFPVYLRSDRDYEVSLKDQNAKIVDIFGRPLEEGLSARWRMDNRPPNFELPNDMAVLEKNVDSDVPLYVNNLTDRDFNFSRLTTKGVENGLTFHQALDPIRNLQYAIPFGVRDLLSGGSGAVLGQLTTIPKTRKSAQTVFAQVTPFGLHVKLAHYNTLVWVTDLATGEAVEGARVSFVRDPALMNALCGSDKQMSWQPEDERGFALTNADGLAVLPGKAPTVGVWRSQCDRALTVKAVKGDDLAILPLFYQFEADTYRASGEQIWSNEQTEQEHMRVWGTTAQGVYRAGDTVQFKIYARGQSNDGLTAAPPSSYRVQLIDPTGKLVSETKDISLSEFGATSGEFDISKNGAVGWYRFRLLQKLRGAVGEIKDNSTEEGALGDTGWYAWKPMRVLVSDFTPSSFRVTTTVNGEVFQASQSAIVEGKATLHAGGPYTNATARITAVFDPLPMYSRDPVTAGFYFGRSDATESGLQRMIAQLQMPLDDKGNVKSAIPIPEQGDDTYGNLTFEVAIADDRGKNIANSATAVYAATDRFVGLKPDAWIFQAGKPASYQYIVVDPQGQRVKGSAVDLKIEMKEVTAARVKSAGNVYQTIYNTSWKEAGTCKGTPEAQPETCHFTPGNAGEYRISATVKGSKGVAQTASSDFWVTGHDVVLWDGEQDTALQMFPEKASYKVGETSRYLIKNPYPHAKALITVERYGVIDHFVKTFDSSTPIVEFPVKPEYAPGFYVSVVLLSPRVAKPLGENMVDLGKPSFRMGYVAVPVSDPYNEIAIDVKTDGQEYRPGDKVAVKLHAEPRHEGDKQPIEFAVAVLDQAIFDLVTGGKAYFDPYRGLYRLDNLDVRNYNLLLKLVGRQKFEKKGANPGGDGGSDLKFRDATKYVAYWNPSILADAHGDANFDFVAPDNLTGWQVLALAVTPTDKAGLGSGDFKVNRLTEIRPMMPNQVLEGDKFSAGFSVMNRTDKPRQIAINIQAEGDVDAPDGKLSFSREILLDAFARQTIFVSLKASDVSKIRDRHEGSIGFKVSAGDKTDHDGLAYRLPIGKDINLVTAAAYGTTDKDDVTTPVAIPKDIRPDAGSLSVTLSSTVVSNVSAAFRYIANYPFLCWEQRLTKSIMAANFAVLRKYLPEDLRWDDAPQNISEAMKSVADFQAPNGGMAYWVATNERVDPYLSAYTALGFTWLHDRGIEAPRPVEEKLQSYLQAFLRKDEAPEYYDANMIASVRAVALAALGRQGHVTLRDIERLRPHFKTMGLFGDAMLLQASVTLHDEAGARLSKELVDIIYAHANQTSGKLLFSENQGQGFARILSTPLRDNCAILSSLVAYSRLPGQKAYVEENAFKLVRMISQSQRQEGYWGNTQENMFCANALADYASAFEVADPHFKVSATLDDNVLGEAALDGVGAKPVTLTHEIDQNDIGRDASLVLKREGEGRLYYATRLTYAPTETDRKPINSGIEIHREYSVERNGKRVLLAEPAQIKRGELVRVDIYISLPAARNFVVVNDPVPGGLEPVNRDLATTSTIDAGKADFNMPEGSWGKKYQDWVEYAAGYWSFYHRELRHDSARFYSDYLGAGNYHLSYVAQAIATGEFSRRPVKAEEMYDPDVFGSGSSGNLVVAE